MIIGVLNQKGGVGKTTTSVNLGAALALRGKKVLLVDMDPQGNLSTHLGVTIVEETNESPNIEGSPSTETATIYEVLKGIRPINEVIRHRSDGLDVVPSSLLLSAADLELGGVVGRELILKRALSSIISGHSAARYDVVVVDCPPALGLLSLNALAAVQQVIVPVQSEYLALHGVRQLLDTIDQVRTIYNPGLLMGGVLICLHDNRKRLARVVADTIRSYFGDLVFDTVIRTNVALAEAPSQGQTIFEYAPKSSGAEDYLALCEEILNSGNEEVGKCQNES